MATIVETITAMPAITVICLLCAQTLKVFTPLSGKHLPVVCGLCGLLLGLCCFFWFPEIMPSENLLGAASKGIVSGWAATGLNQVAKQYHHPGPE